MIIKVVAGILMLIIGLFGLLVMLVFYIGHTSDMSRSDYVLGVILSIFLLIGGIYSILSSKKK
jgi:hypothetical protein